MGKKTKELIPRLKPGDVAVICHEDLDEVAATGLARARVGAVINAKSSMTGRYPTPGPGVVAEASIPLIDNVGEEVFSLLSDGEIVEIDGGDVKRAGEIVLSGRLLTSSEVERLQRRAKENLIHEIEEFVENTLEYAQREKSLILGEVTFPDLDLKIDDRPVVVVARGRGYREDLRAIASYIEEIQPVLIGVDGGADALIEEGFSPDLIVGDMDSVSDRALMQGSEILLHAYPDGRSPGKKRVDALGLASKMVACVGTSEDVALLLAYESGASVIVAVGTHSDVVDFFEKGRRGMASTFLVRLKVGSVLMDAKGLSQIYRGRPRKSYPLWVLGAAMAPLLLVALLSEPLRQWIRLISLYVRLAIGI